MSPMPLHELVTSRLRLIAITPAMLESEKAADGRLQNLLHCAIPVNWPPADWEPHVLDLLLAQYRRCPWQMAWHRYIALVLPDGSRTLIGALGAFWRETAPVECEIGYSVLPPHEGQGLATEATQALIDFLRSDSLRDDGGSEARLTSVIAHTFPQLKASVRVMEKCGFQYDGAGEEAGTVRYRLPL